MTDTSRALRRFALFLPAAALLAAQPAWTQDAMPVPSSIQTADEVPWIYEGSDVPRDEEWTFGELDNGLRYGVRENGVPPGQVSIRVRIDAGSLYENDDERGFAHLLEHLLFRESQYLGKAEAIPTWQRLGATFGSDTNAETSPTHTVYKLDLPSADPAKLRESMKLLSGMVRAPVLSTENVNTEVPIVLAEKRERGGPGERISEQSMQTLFAGQRLADRITIGTEDSLLAADGASVQAFYDRWYRPENTVISVVGDMDPMVFAELIETYFADWKGTGPAAQAPDFGDPVAPQGSDADNPVGEVAVIVEPDLPRSFTYGIMRPWRPVADTVEYNEGRLREQLALALINRRLEARARANGSFLYAQADESKISRSTHATLVTFAPLSEDWKGSLEEIRAVIADATSNPPTTEEIQRELAEMQVVYQNMVEQRSVMAGSQLADDLVNAVDIRESVAAPETFLMVFDSMSRTATPEMVLEETRKLFSGDVIRSVYVTPDADEASEKAVRSAMLAPVKADDSARLAATTISFEDLPPIGEPGEIVSREQHVLRDSEMITFANGVKAIVWPSTGEPGRVSVRVNFGAGYRAFSPEQAPYISLGEAALVGMGEGELGQEELDRITTGRKIGFDFGVDDGSFTFAAQTRQQDLDDQLYLFAAKLAMPRWDENPLIRAKAANKLAYESFVTSPSGVLGRDLEYLLTDGDARFGVPTPAEVDATSEDTFREIWEPILTEQGPIEVMVVGDFDREQTVATLAETFGALPAREPIPAEALARNVSFPEPGETVVETHRGDANQAAAVIAWPSGAGLDGIRESRQLRILTEVFNNRLLNAMREKAGASYAPVVRSDWPTEIESGGRIMALAQLRPEDVPTFFAEADAIANDLAANPPTPEELQLVTEPLRNYFTRIQSGNYFWMLEIEGSSTDPRRAMALPTLVQDYSQTTPEVMLALGQKYFGGTSGWRLAIIPEGQTLATAAATSGSGSAATGR
ncbi:insulinase family protein [Erythrobacter litoralis]|uniref:M16 family metallopeptidase n=1 Tax=Erythrobacter litoralis TaxID=39960 RepID=UPI002434C684|nr:M16 family metallopeptidase [Erythrobacter litoralis]MDG6078541.1 insulinase family protein [Erythrobacter litoralis]